MAHLTHYPEMHEAKPAAQIEAAMSHGGRHWYLRTPLDLKGRGVTRLETYTAEGLTPQGQRLVGWHRYKVTEAAFERISAEHDVVSELLL